MPTWGNGSWTSTVEPANWDSYYFPSPLENGRCHWLARPTIDDRSSPWVDLHQLIERVARDRHSPQNILESESGRASPGDLAVILTGRNMLTRPRSAEGPAKPGRSAPPGTGLPGRSARRCRPRRATHRQRPPRLGHAAAACRGDTILAGHCVPRPHRLDPCSSRVHGHCPGVRASLASPPDRLWRRLPLIRSGGRAARLPRHRPNS